MIEWLKLQLGITTPRTLVKDILFCGKHGGKYNIKYFFVLGTDEGTMILDRHNLRVVDHYSHETLSINYLGMDFRHFVESKDDVDLVETMKGLEK